MANANLSIRVGKETKEKAKEYYRLAIKNSSEITSKNLEMANKLPKLCPERSICENWTTIRFAGNLLNKGVKSPCHLKTKILFVFLIYSFFQFS